jgi:type 1 glutamine amidotransferase
MKLRSAAVLLLAALIGYAQSPQQQPRKRRVLAVGDTSTRTYQHASISHALSTIEKLGRESGLYDTTIRTDTQLLTKKRVPGIRNLDDFDAIFFYSIGEPAMTPEQKADLLAFLRDDGKGFVAAHTGNNDFFDWAEYTDLIGGRFDDHPWELFDAPVMVEDPAFPAMKAFPPHFTINDEIYQAKDFSRDRVRVLARLDPNQLDLGNKRVHRADKDFAVAWARSYGKGRVFYSSFGHRPEVWDRKEVQTMYLEALKWSMGMTEADVTPRPLPPPQPAAPSTPPPQPVQPITSTQRQVGQPPKTILALGDVSTSSFQHDSLSHALATIERVGLQAGLYDTLIRTDPQLVTKGGIATATGTLTFYRNLEDFDAILLLTAGEPRLSPQQKADLLSFVRDGKGLVVAHSAIGSFRSWPEFAEMIGGRAEEKAGPGEDWDVTVLAPATPAMSLFPSSFRIRDAFSPVKPRENVRVLAKSGGEIPVAWTKTYGKGRVFVSQLGHEEATWDRRDVQHMYLEAIRWAIGSPKSK